LTNASKHGQARRAVVEIHEEPTAVVLSVRDDGSGFDPTVRTNGFGLLGMRERVELHGGEISIDSAPGQGVTVRASLPVRRSAEAPDAQAATHSHPAQAASQGPYQRPKPATSCSAASGPQVPGA
jgi:signal transduction histidine kinase